MNSDSYNFIDEIQNDKIKSTLIKVETLQKEYEVTLQQYQEAGKTYITSLQTGSSNSQTVFTALKGRTWWGTNSLSEGVANTQKECENMCANSTTCSGATFNPVKKYCWTRTGENGLSVGTDNDYALITQQKAELSAMKYLNERLLELNNQITDELQKINPQVQKQTAEKNQKYQELNTSYSQLLEQKIELDNQLQEYNSIEQEESNQYLYVNQQNISLRFWTLITCLVLLITIKRMLGTTTPPISMTIWLLIIIVLIVLTYSLSTPAGFVMWFVLLLIIVLMKSDNLPSV
jgi:hypothetical protein